MSDFKRNDGIIEKEAQLASIKGKQKRSNAIWDGLDISRIRPCETRVQVQVTRRRGRTIELLGNEVERKEIVDCRNENRMASNKIKHTKSNPNQM